jgi:hypothetical protein
MLVNACPVQLESAYYAAMAFQKDLAAVYGVTTGNFNKAVKRNRDRFPDDFLFQLTLQEMANLIFQNGISSRGHGGQRPQ